MSQVDVIVPCYNYGKFLKECVNSILSQEGVAVRVLVLDDASSDHTPKVGRELASADDRVEYRRHKTNKGHIATYNEGIDWAEGDYLQLLSADDLLPPGALQRAAALMDTHPEIGFVFGQTLTFMDGEPLLPLPTEDTQDSPTILTAMEFIERFWNGGMPLPVSVVVRTSLQKTIGGWRNDLPQAGDIEMWLRFAAHAPVGMLASYQGCYRRQGNNMSLFYRDRPVEGWQQNNAAYRIFFANYGDRVEGLECLLNTRARSETAWAMNQAAVAFYTGKLDLSKAWLNAVRDFYPAVGSWSSYSRMVWRLRLGFRMCAILSRARKLLLNT